MTSAPAVRLVIRWLENALFSVGGVLALWCMFSAGRAYYYAHLPIPAAPSGAALPGDSAATPPPPALVHKPRAWIARLEAPTVSLSATVLEGSDDGTLARGVVVQAGDHEVRH